METVLGDTLAQRRSLSAIVRPRQTNCRGMSRRHLAARRRMRFKDQETWPRPTTSRWKQPPNFRVDHAGARRLGVGVGSALRGHPSSVIDPSPPHFILGLSGLQSQVTITGSAYQPAPQLVAFYKKPASGFRHFGIPATRRVAPPSGPPGSRAARGDTRPPTLPMPGLPRRSRRSPGHMDLLRIAGWKGNG